MRHGIELVRVALRASEREAEPRGGSGVHAINHRVKPKLQRVDAALLVDHRVAMKAGGNALGLRGVGQQVTGDLLDGELIKRQIGIERVDHPIAPRPDGARAILLVTIGVGVAREIQPRLRPALAKMRTGQQPIHQPFVGVGPLVLDKRLRLIRRGRQADKIQREAAD